MLKDKNLYSEISDRNTDTLCEEKHSDIWPAHLIGCSSQTVSVKEEMSFVISVFLHWNDRILTNPLVPIPISTPMYSYRALWTHGLPKLE